MGMDWPMMEWDSFEDMANVVAPKLSSGSFGMSVVRMRFSRAASTSRAAL